MPRLLQMLYSKMWIREYILIVPPPAFRATPTPIAQGRHIKHVIVQPCQQELT